MINHGCWSAIPCETAWCSGASLPQPALEYFIFTIVNQFSTNVEQSSLAFRPLNDIISDEMNGNSFDGNVILFALCASSCSDDELTLDARTQNLQ